MDFSVLYSYLVILLNFLNSNRSLIGSVEIFRQVTYHIEIMAVFQFLFNPLISLY